MSEADFWSMARAAGLFLALPLVTTAPGFALFMQRGGHRGGAPRSRAHFIAERSSILSGVVLLAIGFVLLTAALENSAGKILSMIGATAYLFGGVLVVAAEGLMLTIGYEKVYGLVVIYVVVAFLAEAAIGGALVLTGTLSPWVGWATIAWNLASLVALALFSRRDMYFPILHYLMPMVIGCALLLGME